jgi:FMN reductase
MSTIVLISGSPSPISRTAALLEHVGRRLVRYGHNVAPLTVRDLPAEALLAADIREPRIRAAADLIESADAVVIGSPIYKAAYSGLLKALLDLLPQFALAGKAVLPLATGGSLAHVLAIDYALRPVLTSLGARHVVQGYFVLDSAIALGDDGRVSLDPQAEKALSEVIDGLAEALPSAVPAGAVAS